MTRVGTYIAGAIVVAIGVMAVSACKGGKRQDAARDTSAGPGAPEGAPDREPGTGPAWMRAVMEALDPYAPSPERIVITQVKLETQDPAQGQARELYPRELARELGRQLTQTPFFVSRAADVPPGLTAREATIEVRVSYDVVDSVERGGRVAVATIQAELVWADTRADDPAPSANIFAEKLLGPDEQEDEDDLVLALVINTLAKIGHGLIAKEQARVGGREAVAQALASTDIELVLWALDLIADRGQAYYYDEAVARLASPEPMIRNRALTTLVALRDPRAVDALAKHAAFDDHEFMTMVIEAVTALGGHDAREYLEFIASGHPDNDLRDRAREGLERLGRDSEH